MKAYALVTLVAALAQMKFPQTFMYTYAVGEEKVHPTEKFEIHTKKANRRMAPFVGEYSDGAYIEKTGFAIEEFEPPIIKPYMVAKADRILKQQFGQTIYGNSISTDDRKLIKVGEELGELDNMIIRRESWMIMKLLTEGIIPVIGEGVNRAITYGDANIEKMLGDSLWTSPNSDPLALLQEKIQEVGKETGNGIDTLIMSHDAYEAFEKHPIVNEYLKHNNAALIHLEPKDVPEGGKYMGYIPKLGVAIYTFSEWYYNEVTKKEEALLPPGAVVGLKKGFIKMNYGAITQIPDGEEEEQLFIEKRVPHTWVKPGSNKRNVQLQSKPLPVPNDARGWFTVTVI